MRDASQIVPTRTPKDILKCVKLTIAGDECRIEATDGESSIIRYVRGGELQRSGSILLPAANLNRILAELTGETVTIEVVETAAKITSGRVKLTIPTQDAADFPPLLACDYAAYYTITAAALKQALRRTLPFCDVASTRFALSGVKLAVTGPSVTFESTDSVRGSRKTALVTATESLPPSCSEVIATVSAMTALASILGDEPVDFVSDKTSIFFRSGDFALCCRLVAGRFPNLDRVLKIAPSCEMQILPGPLAEALRQACLTISAESASVVLRFSGGTLTVTSKTADAGNASIEIPVAYEGDGRTCIDPVKLLPALKQMPEGESVTLKLTETGPIFVTSDGWEFMQCAMSE